MYTCTCINFCFQNFGNGKQDRNGHRYTAFGFDNERKFSDTYIFFNLTFLNFETAVAYMRPFLSSLSFPKL